MLTDQEGCWLLRREVEDFKVFVSSVVFGLDKCAVGGVACSSWSALPFDNTDNAPAEHAKRDSRVLVPFVKSAKVLAAEIWQPIDHVDEVVAVFHHRDGGCTRSRAWCVVLIRAVSACSLACGCLARSAETTSLSDTRNICQLRTYAVSYTHLTLPTKA